MALTYKFKFKILYPEELVLAGVLIMKVVMPTMNNTITL